MKTITANRYSYNFYKAEDGQPIVEWLIEGEVKQVVRVTAEAGNKFYKTIVSGVADKYADSAFVQMLIACEKLNGFKGSCKIA